MAPLQQVAHSKQGEQPESRRWDPGPGRSWQPRRGDGEERQAKSERRVAAKNEWKIIGKYVSGNVAVVQTELKIGFIEYTGVDHVVVWSIYEVTGDKIAAVTLAGQRTDPETKRFIEYSRPTR